MLLAIQSIISIINSHTKSGYSGYLEIKEYGKIYSVNPSYLIFRHVNGYFEGINGKKYLMLLPINESK